MKGFIALLLSFGLLMACSQREDLAPVVESNWREYDSTKTAHAVQHGETLYAIAFRYDTDYRKLAQINHLHSPYTLYAGQKINLTPHHRSRPQTPAAPKPLLRSQHTHNRLKSEPKIIGFDGQWSWPAQGKVTAVFKPDKGQKGIEIAGSKGEKIRAASSGVVAYAGNGLSGYGNLIIIKHNNQYLTAYGNNAKNLVREGQQIKKGEVIASMGVVNRRFWGLHFEIRKAGKPVNPLNYLKKA